MNLDGGQPGFFVKEFDKDVKWQLSAPGCSTVEAMMSSLQVLVRAYRLLENCPVGRAPHGSVDQSSGHGCLHSLKVPSTYQVFAWARYCSCWSVANIR